MNNTIRESFEKWLTKELMSDRIFTEQEVSIYLKKDKYKCYIQPSTIYRYEGWQAALSQSQEPSRELSFITSKELLAQFKRGRPLEFPLDDYWKLGTGNLKYQWEDKPHRLIYDLINALLYYTSPPISKDEDKTIVKVVQPRLDYKNTKG